MSFEIAYQALRSEITYVETTGQAQASVTGSIVDLPGKVPTWGGWQDIGDAITSCFTAMHEKVGTAEAGLDTVATTLEQVLADYKRTEASNIADAQAVN